MDEKLITSTSNPLIKGIRALRQRKHRDHEGKFFVEGIRPVWQAVESGADVKILLLAPDLLTSQAAREMVEAQVARGTQVATVSAGVFEGLAEREHPSGLGALVGFSSRELGDLTVSASSVFVALNEAGNPGNIGTIVRTLDAIGGSALVLVGSTGDPYHPAGVKASMGSVFNVPIARVASLDELLGWSDSHGVNVITTSPRAFSAYWSVEYPFPLMVLFGGEGEGLAGETLERGAIAVHIPMAGTADSLNLAVSAGIVLYEIERQRSGVSEKFRLTG